MPPASPPPLHPLLRFALPAARSALALALAWALAGCAVRAQPVHEIGLDRSTPRKAYEYLKAMVKANQVEAEWRSFSPAFKRRISERAGRTIDIGDYAHARATIASNTTREIGLILDSEVIDEQMVTEDLALMTIRSGRTTARPRWVRMKTWELRLKGEGEPVSEFVGAGEQVVRIASDGSLEVHVVPSSGTAAFLRGIPPERIEEMHVAYEWYLDDFGGVGEAVVGGARSGSEPRPAPPPRPAPSPAPPPARPLPAPSRVPTPPPPSTPDGFGSPDGVTLR